MGVQWISFRRKSELQAILKEFGQDTEGTVEELRGRLAQFANQPGLPTAIAHRLAEYEATLESDSTSTPIPSYIPETFRLRAVMTLHPQDLA